MQPDQSIQMPPATQTQVAPTDQTPLPLQSTPTPQPPKKYSSVLKGLVILVVLGLLGGVGYIGYQSYSATYLAESISSPQPTPTTTSKPTPADPTANWVERKFEKLGLTFKAPADLTMEESEESSGQLVSSIQNDKIGEEFFQMYFVYQKTGKKVREVDLQTFKNDPKLIIPGTARDIQVDGYNGFAGQVADKAKRFITAIVKNGYWLIIYTAEPTQTNKELSDRITSTFKFTD